MKQENIIDIPEILIKSAACCCGESDVLQYNDCGIVLKGKKRIFRKVMRAIRKKELYENTEMSVKRRLSVVLVGALLMAVMLLYTLPVLSLLNVDTGVFAKLDIITALSGADLSQNAQSRFQEFPEPNFPEGTQRRETLKYSAAFSAMYIVDGKNLHYICSAGTGNEAQPLNYGNFGIHLLVHGYTGTASVKVADADTDRYCAVRWEDENFTYTLSGSFEVEELVKYADSIYDSKIMR